MLLVTTQRPLSEEINVNILIYTDITLVYLGNSINFICVLFSIFLLFDQILTSVSWAPIPVMRKLSVLMFLVPTPADVYLDTQGMVKVTVKVRF